MWEQQKGKNHSGEKQGQESGGVGGKALEGSRGGPWVRALHNPVQTPPPKKPPPPPPLCPPSRLCRFIHTEQSQGAVVAVRLCLPRTARYTPYLHERACGAHQPRGLLQRIGCAGPDRVQVRVCAEGRHCAVPHPEVCVRVGGRAGV